MLDQRSLAHAPRTLDNEILSRLGEFLELALKLGPWAEVLPGDNTSIFKRVHARNYTKSALRKSRQKIAHFCAARSRTIFLAVKFMGVIIPYFAQPFVQRVCGCSPHKKSYLPQPRPLPAPLHHHRQSNDLVQLRHVQAPLNGEFIGAFELCGPGDEVHGHCVRSSSPQGGLPPR